MQNPRALPADGQLLDFGLGFPEPCGSKGPTKRNQKIRTVLSRLGFTGPRWRTSGDLHKGRKDQKPTQERCLCCKAYFTLQTIAWGQGRRWVSADVPTGDPSVPV